MRAASDMQGALALVTGAGSGIGRATALAFAARGARVLCTDIDADAAKLTAEGCATLGAEAHAHPLDVADLDAARALSELVTAAHGPVDVLVNNAGVGMSGSFLDTAVADWDWIIDINVRGIIHCGQAFGPAMLKAGRGHVFNIASGLAYTMRGTEIAYVTTKAAVLALSRALRTDWRPQGVNVTAVCPGVIDTPIIKATRFLGERDDPTVRASAQALFSRVGRPPEKVAAAILANTGRDRVVLPVGVEAWFGWLMQRLLPVRAADAVASATDRLTDPGRRRGLR